ncbi:transcriptional regulatory protein [Mycobacteroides abscessus subsp. abscessus]|uniref:IclR family transcriptional regulator n=1 Tax=Brevibacterium casei TaxID=33889 RepID=UPI00092A52F5|nr:IclR family transcriptional regulator [Brevibacterium casei]SII60225.1 transcriptional regulatory protein [Mycobacteroides abscessus subsp. abscessus]
MTRLTAPALRRGLDILELLIDEDRGLKVPEITQRLDLPRATTHELINTLADRGYVAVSADTGRVTLGIRTLRLGAGYERNLDIAEVGRQCASEVARECGETVQIAVRDSAFAVYIVRIDSTHPVRLVSQVGSRLPATCTAGGKMLLSALPAAELTALIPDDDHLEQMTPRSISTLEQLDAEMARARENGWIDEFCESNDHVTCVAAPVYGKLGEMVAAMSISIPMLRWKDEDRERYVTLARSGALTMSELLGAPDTRS